MYGRILIGIDWHWSGEFCALTDVIGFCLYRTGGLPVQKSAELNAKHDQMTFSFCGIVMKNPNVLSNSLHIYDQEYHMLYRNTYFSDYLVYLFEQFHTCYSNFSHCFPLKKTFEHTVRAIPFGNLCRVGNFVLGKS